MLAFIPFLFTNVYITFIMNTVITVAFWFGIAYLGGKLLAPDAPEEEGAVEGARSRMWDPHTTQREGLARPRAYGKNMHPGNIIAKWTDVDGDEREILYLLINHGDGPTEGVVAPVEDNIFINDQPASHFGDVDIQERVGTMNQTCMTGFEQLKLEYVPNITLLNGEPYTFTTPNTFFDDIEWTFSFPQGIRKYHGDGGTHHQSIHMHVSISVHDAEAWTLLFNDNITANQVTPLFKQYLVSDFAFNCARGTQYDVKFERISSDFEGRHIGVSVIRSIREIVDTAFTHPGKALVGLRAIATTQLSGRLNAKVIREDRIIGTYNGTAWTLEYSNNRSWVIWDELTQPVIDGDGGGNPWVITRYDGIDPKYLDLEFFYTFAQFCEEHIPDGYGGVEDRCPCNTIISEFTNVFTKAHELAAVGRAYIYWSGNLLTGWIDVVTTPIDLVTMDSMMNKTWKNAWAIAPELAGKVEVFYQDERQGYERTFAERVSTGTNNYKNPVSVEGVGLKTRGCAIHYAWHLLERNRLIRNMNKFQIHKDAFRYKLGDTIRLQCRIANWGSAFIVKSSTADTVTVDRDVESEVSAGDVIHIRSYNTVTTQVITDTYEVDLVSGRVITATISWDVTPLKGNLVAVGPAGAIKLRRIIKLTPTVDNYFDVEVETYDVDLFDADDLDPDNPNRDYIWPMLVAPIGVSMTQAEIEAYITKMLLLPPNIDAPWTSNLTWTGSGGDTVTWSKTDADEDVTFRYKGASYIIEPDSTTDKYIYWDGAISTTEFQSSNVQSDAIGIAKCPVCFNNDGVPDPAWGYRMIATQKVIDNAITDDAAAYTEGGQELSTVGLVSIQSIVFTSKGGPIFIHCTTLLIATLNFNKCQLLIKRWLGEEATAVYTGYTPVWCEQDAGSMVSIPIKDTPAAGTYTYELVAQKNLDGARDLYAYNTSMFVQELKK